MRIFSYILTFILLTLLFSCEEMKLVTVDCDQCSNDDISLANINIKVDTRFGQCTIRIYDGNLEDNVLYSTFNTMAKVTYTKVPVNKKFTLTATYYYKNGDYYIAVDAITPRVRYDKYSCDEPCYYPYDNTADLRIKYLK